MKKFMMSVAFATMALFATSAYAQQDSVAASCQQACKIGQAMNNPGMPCAKPDSARMNKGGRMIKGAIYQFAGINMNDKQQAKIKELDAKYYQKMVGASRGQQDAIYKDYMKEVKGILTAEQYTQYLENLNFNSGMHRGPKHDKRGFKDSKPRKAKKGDKQQDCRKQCDKK